MGREKRRGDVREKGGKEKMEIVRKHITSPLASAAKAKAWFIPLADERAGCGPKTVRSVENACHVKNAKIVQPWVLT